MKTLYTAFKGKNNTSYQLISALNSQALFITNSFQGAKRDVLSVNEELYDSVFMFGIDKSLTDSIKIELSAAVEGDFLDTDFDIEKLTSLCDQSCINYSINNSPAVSLCNTAYYYMLKKKRNTIFIHIPSIGRMNPDFMKLLTDLFANRK